MDSLRATQHKRVVALAVSTIVFCIFSIWQLSDRVFDVGFNRGFEFTNREIYLLSTCTLIFMAVVVILVRSFEDNAKIRYYEYHDRHTGLPNKTKLLSLINRHMRESGDAGFVLIVDLARLKAINNSLGSEAGDEAMAAYAGRLNYLFKEPNVVARLHGGTYAIFLPSVEDRESATKLAAELFKAVGVPLTIKDRSLFLSIDVGGCFLRDAPNGAGQLIQRAELALIDAKSKQIRELQIYSDELAARIRHQSMLETDLHEVLENEGLEPYFQPLVAEDGKTVVGFEALARWNHPKEGFIAPTSFVPVAEELNLTEKLGRQILLKACRYISKLPGMKVSVNMSPKDLFRPGFVAEVQAVLFETGLDPERLEIEITESIFISETDRIAQCIRDMRLLGISVALDDFGTGYSGLSYLDKYKVDRIKIDASFVREIETSCGARSMISTIIGMARQRGYAITVEGIETEAQFEFLKQFEGLVYQGFLFAKPMHFADLIDSPLMQDHEIEVFEADSEAEKAANGEADPAQGERGWLADRQAERKSA